MAIAFCDLVNLTIYSSRRKTVVKPEWGNKHICGNCGARFYDMKKEPATCPKCGTVQEAEKRKGKKKAPPKPAETEATKAAPVAEAKKPAADGQEDDDILDDEEDDDLLLDDEEDDDFGDLDDEDDDALMEDASDLGDEDDDLSEAKEHMEEEDL